MASQIKSGALLSYIGLGINILIGLIYTPWMVHSIGKDNYGLYTLAMSIITLFVFDFGLSSAITRFMAKYIAEGNIRKANICLSLAYKLYIWIDLILFLILISVYFFIPSIYESLTPEEIQKFKIVYIIASCFSIISFPFIPLNSILNANEKFIQIKICELFHKIIIVITMSICLILGFGLYALVAVNVIAGIIMILMKLYCVKKFTHTHINLHYSDKSEQHKILSFSGWVTITSICQRSIFNIAPSILGIMSGAGSIAILGVAITIEGYTYTFSNALNGLFLPRVSRIVANNKDDLLPLMVKVGRIQAMIISIIFLGFLCLGKEFIHLWMGHEFSKAYVCAMLLIAPAIIHLPQEIASTAIIVENKVIHQAYIYITMAVANIGLAFYFSSILGAIGISLSICIAYFIRTFGLNIIYVKDLKLDIFNFFTATYSKLILPSILIICVTSILNLIINNPSWINFIIKATIFCTLSLFLFWFTYMNQYEKYLIRTCVQKVERLYKRK